MKTKVVFHSTAGTGLMLLKLIAITGLLSLTGCFADKKVVPSSNIEMVVVFNKNVRIEKANSIMFEKNYIFREGIDSSKGKQYSLDTGPKFIVIVPKDKLEIFNNEMKSIPEIFETYYADWSVNKD